MRKPKTTKTDTNTFEIKNLKGHYVWWDIKQLDIQKDKLEANLAKLGYEDMVPRNDYKTCLIRALRFLLKGDVNERTYKRVEGKGDDLGLTHLFVLFPKWFYEQESVTGVSLNSEMKISVNKETGKLSFDNEAHPFVQKVKDQYREAKKFLDVGQFRTILTKIVQDHCYGCTVKNHGGVYYVPEAYIDQLESLRRIFRMFPENVCMLFETPVYNDDQTDRAIEYSVSSDILDEMNALVEEGKAKDGEGKITERIVGNRREQMRKLMKRIKIHENDLRSQADNVLQKAQKLEKIFGDKTTAMGKQKKFDLTDALNNWGKTQ